MRGCGTALTGRPLPRRSLQLNGAPKGAVAGAPGGASQLPPFPAWLEAHRGQTRVEREPDPDYAPGRDGRNGAPTCSIRNALLSWYLSSFHRGHTTANAGLYWTHPRSALSLPLILGMVLCSSPMPGQPWHAGAGQPGYESRNLAVATCFCNAVDDRAPPSRTAKVAALEKYR